ncbi:hypothetical protein CP966_34340 [Streptomyces galilaeus]|nr:hypothetical protein CP966_34340 [Streptomyces galilaeus]
MRVEELGGQARQDQGLSFGSGRAVTDGSSRLTRAGSGACNCKAEEGVDAMGVPPLERSREWGSRRPTTTPQMRVPDPATPA